MFRRLEAVNGDQFELFTCNERGEITDMLRLALRFAFEMPWVLKRSLL